MEKGGASSSRAFVRGSCTEPCRSCGRERWCFQAIWLKLGEGGCTSIICCKHLVCFWIEVGLLGGSFLEFACRGCIEAGSRSLFSSFGVREYYFFCSTVWRPWGGGSSVADPAKSSLPSHCWQPMIRRLVKQQYCGSSQVSWGSLGCLLGLWWGGGESNGAAAGP